MDWKRVKNILICMLLLTNLILAASIYSEFTARRRAEQRAVRAAIELIGGQPAIDESIILALPDEIYALRVPRNNALEDVFAGALLGAGTAGESGGGGIYRFEGANGRGEIKRGGEISFTLENIQGEASADFFRSLLTQAGLEPLRQAASSGVRFEQYYDGYPVLDYVLDCTREGISGRWLISDTWSRQILAPTRAELVIRLAGLARERGIQKINAISCAYFVENTGGQDSMALPVWIIDSSAGTIIYDLVGGRVLER